jgi:hypothetical protein
MGWAIVAHWEELKPYENVCKLHSGDAVIVVPLLSALAHNTSCKAAGELREQDAVFGCTISYGLISPDIFTISESIGVVV